MLIVEKRSFGKGIAMALGFFVVLTLMFSPLYEGANAFRAADRLFNSIAKGSSDYFQALRKGNEDHRGEAFEVTLKLKSDETAQRARELLSRAGAEVKGQGAQVEARGDLYPVVGAALEDAEAMFNNRGKELAAKYGYPEKEVLFQWWTALKEMGRSLKEQEKFKEAAFLEEVMLKGVEVGYNFYGIEPKKASANAGVLIAVLAFYLLYTLWWGYAILFVFDGFGLQMKARSKKEV